MGMSAGGAGRGGRGHRRRGRHHGLMSEINVTPLVDVMLVLLIIFMVAAPLLTSTVPIDLPKANAATTAAETKPLEVSVNREGEIWIGDESYPLGEVASKLAAIAKTGYDERILIRGDKTADYGTIMGVMAEISSAGYKNIGLVGLPQQGS
ncbi:MULTISPECIES: ExbD/TolR family protein [Mesorhizobium]|uniref:Biopolymer transporter ExbD n=1 Tax=Mesorhizobium denitrificans TaxID=2294114 RepID=A0A371XF43_9HYPH|nr:MULTISPECIES: biopolymer transporter ExbD [Mesorhizobium]RFC67813.1 biopolymer transporter ExbD [Mesorhizobium denitrificans]